MTQLMKGHTWKKRKHTMTYPALAECKHDEIRCHVIVNPQNYDVVYLSYAEKMLHNMLQFNRMWVEISMASGIYEFDTGFEVGGSFDKSYRWVRSSKKGIPEDCKNDPCKFYLFDLPSFKECPFTHRNAERSRVYAQAQHLGYHEIRVPAGVMVEDEAEVEEFFLGVRKDGLEGLMVKSLTHMYERGKRTNGWLKVKPEEDADGVIIGLTEAISEEGEPLGRIGSVHVRVEDGSFAKPSGIEHGLGIDMYENPNKYLAQWCEFKFMERDRQGGYRHPTWHRLREAKA